MCHSELERTHLVCRMQRRGIATLQCAPARLSQYRRQKLTVATADPRSAGRLAPASLVAARWPQSLRLCAAKEQGSRQCRRSIQLDVTVLALGLAPAKQLPLCSSSTGKVHVHSPALCCRWNSAVSVPPQALGAGPKKISSRRRRESAVSRQYARCSMHGCQGLGVIWKCRALLNADHVVLVHASHLAFSRSRSMHSTQTRQKVSADP